MSRCIRAHTLIFWSDLALLGVRQTIVALLGLAKTTQWYWA
jgi:hypothetical protein